MPVKNRKAGGRVYFDNPDPISLVIPHDYYWDEWATARDGMRGYNDKTRIKPLQMYSAEYFEVERYNRKLIRLLERRKKMKLKQSVRHLKMPLF